MLVSENYANAEVGLTRITPGRRYTEEEVETQLGHRHGHNELLLVEKRN